MEQRYNAWRCENNGTLSSPSPPSNFTKSQYEFSTGTNVNKSGRALFSSCNNFYPSLSTNSPTVESSESSLDKELEQIWREPIYSSECSLPHLVTRTSSNLSWGEEEVEKESTRQVQKLWEDINKYLYENEISESITPDLQEELQQWARKFPHIRINGEKSKIVPVPINELPLEDRKALNGSYPEEIFAQHGNFIFNPEPDFGILTKAQELDTVAQSNEYSQGKLIKLKEILPNMWSDVNCDNNPSLVIHGGRVNQNKRYDNRSETKPNNERGYLNNYIAKSKDSNVKDAGSLFPNLVVKLGDLFPQVVNTHENIHNDNIRKGHKANEQRHHKQRIYYNKSYCRISSKNSEDSKHVIEDQTSNQKGFNTSSECQSTCNRLPPIKNSYSQCNPSNAQSGSSALYSDWNNSFVQRPSTTTLVPKSESLFPQTGSADTNSRWNSDFIQRPSTSFVSKKYSETNDSHSMGRANYNGNSRVWKNKDYQRQKNSSAVPIQKHQ